MSVIAVDFDGVVRDAATNELMDGARESLRRLAKHHELFVWTANTPSWVRQWLISHGVSSYVTAVHPKPRADIYIDDRAVRFIDWPQATSAVKHLQ